MTDKVYNVESKRFIKVHGQRYKEYLKKGYHVQQNQLLPPIKTIVKTPSPLKLSTKSPEQKVFESSIINTIVKELEPKDLLSLFLTNKDTTINLNFQPSLNYLSQKYNIKPVQSFQEFIKLYHLNQIDPLKLWLYQLENNVEMPTQQYVDMLIKSANQNLNQKLRAIIIDWLYQ